MATTKENNKYYAVRSGYRTGIYTTWEDCRQNIQGYSGAEFMVIFIVASLFIFSSKIIRGIFWSIALLVILEFPHPPA